ncbi:hypothetical protein M5689_006634 [Euphorbia peplus]|nr:hypothetical protein M5689_006634 [Euphorbia peplus]
MASAAELVAMRILLEDHLDFSWYIGERVYQYEIDPVGRRVHVDPPLTMFWARALTAAERDVAAAGQSSLLLPPTANGYTTILSQLLPHQEIGAPSGTREGGDNDGCDDDDSVDPDAAAGVYLLS